MSQPKQVSKLESLRRSLPFLAAVLEDAVRQSGCILCRARHKAEERQLFSFLYEGMMSGPTRQRFLDTGGFCPRHFRFALRIAHESSLGPSGLAILCRQLVPRLEKEIKHADAPRRRLRSAFVLRGRSRAAAAHPAHDCLFCQEGRAAERDLVQMLEGLIEDEDFAVRVAANGLCFRHASMAMDVWKGAGTRHWLGEVTARRAGDLIGDLKEFLRKYEDRFRHEPFGREVDVIRRAMEFISGSDEDNTG